MESDNHTEFPLEPIIDLLLSAGYVDATSPDIHPAHKLVGGLAWCIAAVNFPDPISDAVSLENLMHYCRKDDAKCIEDALRSMKCPHPLHASHIQNLDCKIVLPVLQWLVERVRSQQEVEERKSEHLIEEDEHTLRRLKEDLSEAESSVKTLSSSIIELNQRKSSLLNQLHSLQENINKKGANADMQKLVSLMESLKELELQGSYFESNCDTQRSELQAEIIELEKKLAKGYDINSLCDGLNQSLNESLKKLESAKKELAAQLRDIVAAKRQLDDLPCQSEIIQYDRGFSELNAHIQGKLQQTRKYYATYNALLEIKDLVLKETSILNSIISQFQDAFNSTEGRTKLIDSMEGILKSSQKKLEKVKLGLQEEEKVCDDLKERYAAEVEAQKQFYSMIKYFQEECAKNDRLRSQT